MTKVTRKRQVTIPRKIRELLGIRPGTSVKFKVVEGKYVIEKEIPLNNINKWIGYLGTKRKTDNLIKEIREEIDSKKGLFL